jgi:hypothetical protein
MQRHDPALTRKLYSVSPIQTILDRLDNVRQLRDGYRASCPAHEGKSQDSLWISERDDGSIGLHCFGACDAVAVLHAIGLELKDLYPHPIGELSPLRRRERQQFGQISKWKAALSVLERECDVLTIAHHQLASGTPLQKADIERFQLAGERIRGAKAVLCDR